MAWVNRALELLAQDQPVYYHHLDGLGSDGREAGRSRNGLAPVRPLTPRESTTLRSIFVGAGGMGAHHVASEPPGPRGLRSGSARTSPGREGTAWPIEEARREAA